MPYPMSRRTALGLLMATFAAARLKADEPPPKKTGLGLMVLCCKFRRDALRTADPGSDLFEPLAYLEHCRQLGAGGIQVDLGVRDQDYIVALRRKAEQHGMYLEALAGVPKDRPEVERFEAQIKTAAEAGALAVRTTIMPGRRYEEFDSLEDFHRAEAIGRRSLELAAPVMEKHRIPLAIENHKDHRNAERIALFEKISSEFIGACVDTGNSFALLEDPIATIEALAPWAHSVHLKDQAVAMYEDGFLLGDIPLGQGFFDLGRMVTILQKVKPSIRFTLELITRDPLKVPVLTEKYWATFPDVPGRDLARTLRLVGAGATNNLQSVSTLSLAEQVALEDLNVRASLDYARDRLRL